MPAYILYLDTDSLRRDEIGKVLESGGYHVLKATDTRGAMEVFMRTPVDLALIHFSLSKTDGGIVAFEMRRRKPEVKIVLLSPKEELEKVPRASVDAVIQMDGSAPALLGEIRKLLEPKLESKVA